MSKLDDAVGTYLSAMTTKMSLPEGDIDVGLLRNVAKGLGPTIYNADAKYVSCSDRSELERVDTNFLQKKLGLPASDDNMGAIKAVCEQMAPLKSAKHRPVMYYLLTKHFGKDSVYA